MLRFHTNKLSEATVEFPSSSPCFLIPSISLQTQMTPFLVFMVSGFQVWIFSSFYSNAEFPSWADCNYTSNSSNGLKMPEISRWTRTNTHTAYIHTFVLYWYRYLLVLNIKLFAYSLVVKSKYLSTYLSLLRQHELILQLDNYQEWHNSAFRTIQICVYLTLPSHLEICTSCGLVSPSWLMKFDYPETECS